MLYEHFGYQCVFWTSAILMLIGMLYASLVMEMNLCENENKNSIFNIKLITDTVMVVFKKRTNNRRVLILLLVCCFTIFEMPFPVDDNLLFLYFKVF